MHCGQCGMQIGYESRIVDFHLTGLCMAVNSQGPPIVTTYTNCGGLSMVSCLSLFGRYSMAGS